VERFNVRKLNDVKMIQQCQVKISDMFAALENLKDDDDDDMDISRAWDSIRDNIRDSGTESYAIMN
jgi:hypothetical protein